jgi:hypothetical protein
MEVQAQADSWSQAVRQMPEQPPTVVHFDEVTPVRGNDVRGRIGIAVAGTAHERPRLLRRHVMVRQGEVARLRPAHDQKTIAKAARAAELRNIYSHPSGAPTPHLFAYRQDNADGGHRQTADG